MDDGNRLSLTTAVIVCPSLNIISIRPSKDVHRIIVPFNNVKKFKDAFLTNDDNIILYRLKVINLFANKLEIFEESLRIPNIKYLNVAYNRLRSIDLKNMNPEFIYLHHNILTGVFKSLHLFLSNPYTPLQVVDLSSNNMSCVCGLSDLDISNIRTKMHINDNCDNDYTCVYDNSCNRVTLSNLRKFCDQGC